MYEPSLNPWIAHSLPSDSLVGIETSVTHNRNLWWRKQESTVDNRHAKNSVKGKILLSGGEMDLVRNVGN